MTYDLNRALARLAAEERAAAPGLPVTSLRARAHRRRAVRTATTSGLAVAAVAAVALAAVALPGRLDPPPPAGTPSVTTPAPEETPGAWPTAVTLDGPAPACGQAMPALVRPDGEPELTVEHVTQDGPLVAGAVAEVDVVLEGPAGRRIVAASPELLIVRDGVVVATNRGPQADAGYTYTADESTLTWPSQLLELVRCGSTTGAAPLEVGGYDAYVLVDVIRDDGGAVEGGADRLTVVGGPFPVTLDNDTAGPMLSDLIVSTDGLAAVELGTTPEDTQLLRWEESACAGTDVPGRWVADLPDGSNVLGEPSPPFRVGVLEDRIARVEVLTAGPRTIHGIQVGSSLADLGSAHPEMTLLAGADDLGGVEAWGVVDGERTLAVEVTANPDGGDAFWADDEVVVAMVAVAGMPYTHPAWGAASCG